MSSQFVNLSSSTNESGESTIVGRVKAYGKWSDRREVALVDAMLRYHPFNAKRCERKIARDHVRDAINEVEPHLGNLAKTTIDNKFESLIKKTKEKQINDLMYGAASNNSHTSLEEKMITIISMVKKTWISNQNEPLFTPSSKSTKMYDHNELKKKNNAKKAGASVDKSQSQQDLPTGSLTGTESNSPVVPSQSQANNTEGGRDGERSPEGQSDDEEEIEREQTRRPKRVCRGLSNGICNDMDFKLALKRVEEQRVSQSEKLKRLEEVVGRYEVTSRILFEETKSLKEVISRQQKLLDQQHQMQSQHQQIQSQQLGIQQQIQSQQMAFQQQMLHVMNSINFTLAHTTRLPPVEAQQTTSPRHNDK
ncbi:hypothetical protein CLU79DRAFT_838038 [Phycomyces nitens]|nr:hypothetical protein CLU79DRAFT_838038 [Phycomyces nitens]